VVRGSDTTAPYSLAFNSRALTNGPHALVARAYDRFGNIRNSAGVAFTTRNDFAGPSVSASVPSIAIGTVTLAATASDPAGVGRVEFLVDGIVRGSDNTAPYAIGFDARAIAVGNHSLVARAYDRYGNATRSSSVLFARRLGLSDILRNQRQVLAAPYTSTLVEVDLARIHDSVARDTDPYWFRYYRRFWQNGQFIGHRAYETVSRCVRETTLEGNLLDGSGIYNTPSCIQVWSNGQVVLTWAENHYRPQIGSFAPTTSFGQLAYYQHQPWEGPLAINMGIVTQVRWILPVQTLSSGSSPSVVTSRRQIEAGEVSAEGWGVVPSTNGATEFPAAWIFVKDVAQPWSPDWNSPLAYPHSRDNGYESAE
jgi:hypothetical protein